MKDIDLPFRNKIGQLKEGTVSQKTCIAVFGDVGNGKSSLINALLDSPGIMPTSSFRSCTATVVQAIKSHSENYEADIEFLTKEVRSNTKLKVAFRDICWLFLDFCL